jgi:hypothetical protein
MSVAEPEIDLSQVAELRRKGRTLREIGAAIGRSTATIGRWIEAAQEAGLDCGHGVGRGRPPRRVPGPSQRREGALSPLPRSRHTPVRKTIAEQAAAAAAIAESNAIQNMIHRPISGAIDAIVAAADWDDEHDFAELFPRSECASLAELVIADLRGPLEGDTATVVENARDAIAQVDGDDDES